MTDLGRDAPASRTVDRGASAYVSAREVAARAGVSRSAVSRTFTPGASVAEDTRRRVLVAAEELGYHVNKLARGLSLQQSGIVCVVVSDIMSPQMSRLLGILTRRLQQAGRVAMVLSLSGPDDDARLVLQRAAQYRAEATIVLSGTPSRSIVRSCLESGQRLILISRDDPETGPDRIRLDNAGAARAALLAFVRGGCRHLAVVTTEKQTLSLAERSAGFIEAARAVGIEPRIVSRGVSTSYENGRLAGTELFTGERRPDAVFCVNDVTALGVLDAARHDFGLRVPEDLSVMGFDNIPEADWLSYRLTTFDQPVEDIAAAVVQLVEEGRDPGGDPVSLSFTPTLVWRSSVRC
ncbi:LacI family DNA-binding transcriptional regulator [uncultured Alsobacter sp.]|uniref:LacI family DNA-binding transcriptional regulator n=1 Tax=uncultured Alsobacter sp. TaxID=1748258 RepID=UPI0025FFEAF4|nr:LacI family DNA-binding transcriptional regulator [uncultured Alsobacter sp.]